MELPQKRIYRQSARKPKKEPITETEYKIIEKLAGEGAGVTQLSGFLGFSQPSFELMMRTDQKIKEAIERGRAYGNSAVASTAYKMAISGKWPAMTIFWLKCRMQWKESGITEKLTDELDNYDLKDIEKLLKIKNDSK